MVPKLRFSQFQAAWSFKKLGEIGDIINGLTYSPENIRESGLLVLRSSNIQDGKLCFDDSVYVNQTVAEEKKTKENDILICVRNGSRALIGKSTLIKGLEKEATHGAFMTVFRSPLNDYVAQLLQTKRFFCQVYSDLGATINSINGGNFKKYLFSFPSDSDEVTKIADFLSSVDEKIMLLSKQHELLCQYKKGMMQKIFSQELRFKDENGKTFPEWKNTILDEVVDLITNGLALDQNDSKNGYPVSRIETISEHCINMNKVGFVDTDNDISNYKLNYGDMLFSNINSISHIGKIAYFDIDDILYHGMNLLRIVIKNSHSNLFFYYQLTTDTNKKYFESRANQAVSQASINQTELRKTPVQVPCQEEQTKIANFLSALDDKISTKKAELGKLKTWKQGLLQQMFV